MADLILPGTIPGLLRRGSPVIAPVSKRVRVLGRRALVEGEHLDTGLVLLADGALEDASDLRLDLTDATGRAHAAWWLEGQAPRWRTMMAGRLGGEMLRLLECVETHKFLGSDEREARGRVRLVLNDLDPNDPRLLPDGSRYVDAEALRRVVLHVAGVDRG